MLNWKRAAGIGAAIAMTFVVGTTAVSIAEEEGNEAFELLTDNVKALVLEANEQLGGLDQICELERVERLSEFNRIVAEFRENGKLTGVGFYSLDVGNYYNMRCRDRS